MKRDALLEYRILHHDDRKTADDGTVYPLKQRSTFIYRMWCVPSFCDHLKYLLVRLKYNKYYVLYAMGINNKVHACNCKMRMMNEVAQAFRATHHTHIRIEIEQSRMRLLNVISICFVTFWVRLFIFGVRLWTVYTGVRHTPPFKFFRYQNGFGQSLYL